jgi:signal transduction histidine kinase
LNAVTHGGSDVTVRVGNLAGGFYIEDDGEGIPASAEADVFEAGYSHTSEGTGFGLSIVNQVSNSHGWTVHLDSSNTGGARFEITGVATPE